jgi:N utilization substance protein B
MLSRHFLRSKVLQAVYSSRYEGADEMSVAQNFEYHIQKLNELGVLQVSLLPRFVEVAGEVLEEGKKKFRPTEEDRNPSMRLVENEFVRRMADNFELKKAMESWCGCWETHEDLIREAFLEFRKTKEYREYVSEGDKETGDKETSRFEEDKAFAILLFRYLMNRESLRVVGGERSLLWEDDFDQIAQYNFMMMKALEEDSFDEASVWPMMYDKREDKDEADMQFARELLKNTIATREESEELVKSHLQGWEFERVSKMDVLLINMAVAELTGCPTIPERVTVDEYIELSKEFSTERSKLFINGILDKFIIELRSAGRINKTGRGLYDPSFNPDEED